MAKASCWCSFKRNSYPIVGTIQLACIFFFSKNSCANNVESFILFYFSPGRESPLRRKLSAIKSQSRSFAVGCVMDGWRRGSAAIAILIAH
jgi:hypothetical protein